MFLGIDPSLTGTGLVILDKDYKIIKTAELSVKVRETERLYFLEEEFLRFINNFKILLACIEAPAFGIREGNLHSLGQWSGVLELALFKLNIKFIHCSPTQTKKYCLGSGKGEKSLILLKTFQNFGEEFSSDNICDAYIISRLCADYYHKYIENAKLNIKKYQLEVLKKIHENNSKRELI